MPFVAVVAVAVVAVAAAAAVVEFFSDGFVVSFVFVLPIASFDSCFAFAVVAAVVVAAVVVAAAEVVAD